MRAAALGACVLLLLAGCYLGERSLTYPSPHPSGGDRVIYPGEFVGVTQQTAAGVSEFASICRRTRATGPTRDAVAFVIEGVELCFLTPSVDDNHLCVSAQGNAPGGSLIFHAFVSGEGVAVGALRATLRVNGESAKAAGEVRSAPYASSAKNAPPDAKPLNPGAAYLLYSVSRQELAFRFDRSCDPSAHFRLAVSGITVHGHEVDVPPVDFDPYTEWRPIYVD
jgi:hypothetical protein